MFYEEFFIVFPEGDIQEVQGRLNIGAIVDLNGNPLPLPLSSPRIIAFQISKIRVDEKKGSRAVYHHLDLLSAFELEEYCHP